MADFSHLSKLNPSSDRTAEYAFYQIEGEPVLYVLPAAESNRPFYNSMLRRAPKTQRRLKGGGINEGLVREARDEDRELYAKFIVRGWKGVVDSEGKEVPFSFEACEQFLTALPNWLFDDLRAFCGELSNFLEEDAVTQKDAEDLGKN